MSAKPAKNLLNNKEIWSSKTSKDIKIATSNLFVKSSDIPIYANINEIVLQDLNSGQILDYGDNSLFFGDGSVGTLSGNALIANIMQSSSTISSQYNPKSLLSTTNYQEDYKNQFLYSLIFYVPIQGTGENGEIVYLDSSNNLIINTVNVQDFQEVEVEFWKYGVEINDTIVE